MAIRLGRWLIALCALVSGTVAAAQPDTRPIVVNAHARVLGVGSCGGSTCHGRQEATGAVVRQDEIRIWQDPASVTGAHLRAYQVLLQPRSQAIAAKLGIGPAERSRACLGCHSTPAPLHTAGYHVEDGVQCEACHGPAEGWIASHTAVRGTHADNVSRGMLALDRPQVRAQNCLDCHYGAAGDQFVTHRLMAAGHPRIAFELELFSALQQHWNVDADYRQRKQLVSGVKMWAVGQTAALDRQLALYSNPTKASEGAFPEFYFFDCRSCHRNISDEPAWRPTRGGNSLRPIPPGTPVFNDENMLMLAAAAEVAAPDLARRFDADARAFHMGVALGRGPALAAAQRLRATTAALEARFEGARFDRAQTFAMLHAILTGPGAARLTDYQGSAQSVMAADTLVAALEADGSVPKGTRAALKPEMDRAYAVVRDPEHFRQADVNASLARVADAVTRYQ